MNRVYEDGILNPCWGFGDEFASYNPRSGSGYGNGYGLTNFKGFGDGFANSSGHKDCSGGNFNVGFL